MQSDWYKTTRPGTYVIVPAGMDPVGMALPEDVRSLLEVPVRLYSKDVASAEMARSFDFLGVEDCLRKSGYCVLRS